MTSLGSAIDHETEPVDRPRAGALAPDHPLEPPGRRLGGARFSLALLAALGLHGAALAAIVVAVNVPLGSGGSDTDIVEVTLVPGTALESRTTAATASIVARSPSVAEKPGAAMERAAAEASPSLSGTLEPAETPDRDAVPPVLSRMILPRAGDAGDEPSRQEAKSDGNVPPAAEPVAVQSESAAGGAQSRADAPAILQDAPAFVSASLGVVHAYNQSVATALSKLKPRGVGEAGLAKVVFRIGTGGEVDDVQLAASTGKSKLDRLATDTVARAKFSAPPAGMTSAQLTYAIAFRFR